MTDVLPVIQQRVINQSSFYVETPQSSSSLSSLSKNSIESVADTGASGHYFSTNSIHDLNNVIPLGTKGVTVTLPDGNKIKSTHQGLLDIKSLPETARVVNIFPDIHSSLLSIGQLCDADCKVNFDKNSVNICKDDKIILTGTRNMSNKLWNINISSNNCNSLIRETNLLTTNEKIVNFYHACLGSPTEQQYYNAVLKGWVEFPGLTANMIPKYLSKSRFITRGHMKLLKQNLRSSHIETNDDICPKVKQHNQKHIQIMMRVVETPRLFIDSTGGFIEDTTQVWYDLVMFSDTANYIHVESMDNRNAGTYEQAFNDGLKFFRDRDIPINILRLDNEQSSLVSAICVRNKIKLELVPPGNHRSNTAERAIDTWKSHKISMMATADEECDPKVFKHFNKQGELTINLLRQSGMSKFVSAWHQVNGKYNFNNTPIAPPGIKVEFYQSRSRRESTWSPKSVKGFYVGPAMDHHRCYKIYSESTNHVIISDTVEWFPKREFIFPGQTPEEEILKSVEKLSTAISNFNSTNISTIQPVSEIKNNLVTALNQFKILFQNDNDTDDDNNDIFTDNDNDNSNRNNNEINLDHNIPPVSSQQKVSTESPNIIVTNQVKKTHQQHQYKIAKILKHQWSINQLKVLVKWSSRPFKQDSWETIIDNTDPITKSQAFKTYVTNTNDRQLFNNYIDTVIQDNNYLNLLSKTESTHHHGIKHLDSGDKLRYLKAIKGKDKVKWEEAQHEEWDRLFNQWKTIKLIHRNEVPSKRTISYYNPQLTIKIQDNQKIFRVRGTYGGNITDYTGLKAAQTANLPSVKILLNSVVSDVNAKFMTIDIKDYFLNSKLEKPEYMRIPITYFPIKSQLQFSTSKFINKSDNTVIVEVTGSLYGLPQAAKVSYDDLLPLLISNDFQLTTTPCVFKHKTRNIQFALIVDDFGVKYSNIDDAMFLIKVLQTKYKIAIDWSGTLFIGLTIHHDRDKRTLTISMPGYVDRLLQRFDIIYNTTTDSPMKHDEPVYGRKQQYTQIDNSPKLSSTQINDMQKFIGGILYYARGVGYSYYTTTNKLASSILSGTQTTWQQLLHFMNYAATWPEASVTFYASDMVLLLDADASYLSESKARSRAGGVAYLGRVSDPTFVNGLIDCMSTILPTVCSSVCEAEYASAFELAVIALPYRRLLIDLGYKQHGTTNNSTIITTDNQCAEGIANETVKQKRTRALDMRYHWLRDRIKLGDFTVKWRSNIDSLADFFTKTLSKKDHLRMRQKFVNPGPRASLLKGCVNKPLIETDSDSVPAKVALDQSDNG